MNCLIGSFLIPISGMKGCIFDVNNQEAMVCLNKGPEFSEAVIEYCE